MQSQVSWKSVIVILALAVIIGLLFRQGYSTQPPKEMSFSWLLEQFDSDSPAFKAVQVDLRRGKAFCGEGPESPPQFTVNIPPDPELASELPRLGAEGQLRNDQIDVTLVPPRWNETWVQIVGYLILPIALVLFFYFMFVRQMQSTGGQAITFGKSRHQRFQNAYERVTFDDVAGVDEAKEELEEVVEFLREPEKFRAVGAEIPKGVLLTGPPGSGKTLLARAIAGEANVPFLYISGSDFVEMFVGVGASRVRDLFEQAKHHDRCIVFIDEIDAVGRHRGTGIGGGHDEREQTLNQLLVEMDGFDKNSGVIILAATNRPDVLDPALLRPGRFDRRIQIDAPDVKGREAIVRIYIRERPTAEDVSVETLARRTPGFTGADCKTLVNEGSILAARRGKVRIDMVDLEDSIDRVYLGIERKSRVLSDEERNALAIHEAGHALVGMKTMPDEPVHKVSIVSRGKALGFTMQLPAEDRHMYSRDYLLGRITSTLGGRAAEEAIIGQCFSGAADDLSKVTDIARAMVCTLGMSERIGPLTVGRSDKHVFLGRDIMEDHSMSEELARVVDEEMRAIVEQCHSRAKEIIQTHRLALDRIVEALLEVETLQGDLLGDIVREADAEAGLGRTHEAESEAAPAE